ncbi:hypothetical protein BASA81_001924 [Batrachochytrium salamandrivorans]|nr:hypothetical protein BASA81_001924 [Batrachochytrium salamandrivorans]
MKQRVKKVKEEQEEEEEEEEEVQLFKKPKTCLTPLPPPRQAQAVSSTLPVQATRADNFKALGLGDWVCNTLTRLKLSKPTPVQVACVPAILHQHPILLTASAPTGSGKTAAFALPILHRFAQDPYGVFALVLTPTRELAQQIYEQFLTLGHDVHLRCELVIGGVNQVAQQLALQRNPHIVVATPGRMASHLLGAKPPVLSRMQFLVLDESDRLLKKGEGFENDLVRISKHLKVDKLSVLLFSATLTNEDVARAQMMGLTNGRSVDLEYSPKAPIAQGEEASNLKPIRLCPTTLTQTLTLIPMQAKHAYLSLFLKSILHQDLIDKSKLKDAVLAYKPEELPRQRTKSMIIFTSTCHQCQVYAELLQFLGLPVVALHSELTQEIRTGNLAKFRSGNTGILVATDVASRGLDIPTVDVVLNLDVPRECDNYLHRVGRCARAARLGRSFMFVTASEVDLVKAIEQYIGEELEVFELEGDVAAVLRRSSVAKVKALTKLHRDGFMDRLDVRKERRKSKTA